MALDKFKALAADVDAAATRLIALAQGSDAALLEAHNALAAADDEATSTLQPIADKLLAAAPAPAVDAAAGDQPAA